MIDIGFNSVLSNVPKFSLKFFYMYVSNRKCLPQIRGRYNFCKSFNKALEVYLSALRSDSFSKSFTLFHNYDDAKRWGEKYFGSWSSSLNEEEIFVIRSYVGNTYRPTNKYLRTGKCDYDCKQYLENEIQIIDDALSRATIAQNIIVFRWMGYNGFYELSSYKEIFAGDIFTEKGFMSTSLTFGESLANTSDKKLVLLVIRVPKGTKGAYMRYGIEFEVLLRRGQKLRKTEIIYFKNDEAIFLCDIIS